jgi:hypothetical protein
VAVGAGVALAMVALAIGSGVGEDTMAVGALVGIAVGAAVGWAQAVNSVTQNTSNTISFFIFPANNFYCPYQNYPLTKIHVEEFYHHVHPGKGMILAQRK